jgi:tetratricopeptide (TPR) repeat protein
LDAAEATEDTLRRLLAFGDRWLADADDVKRATERYELAAEMFADRSEPLEKMLVICQQANRVERVLSLRRELAARTDDPRGQAQQHHDIGSYCLEHGRDEEALVSFETALDCDPSFLQSLEQLASRLGEDQEWGELERIYRKVYDAVNSATASKEEIRLVSEIQHRMALLYRDHLEDPESALNALDRALEHRPRQVATLLLAAEVAQSLKDPGRALAYLRRVADLEPRRGDTYHRMFALAQAFNEARTARLAASVVTVLDEATEEESAFYDSAREPNVPPHRSPMSDEAWAWLAGELREPAIERVMCALTPTVLRYRMSQLSASGKLAALPDSGRQDPSTSTLSVVRSMVWAAQYLGGIRLPSLYVIDGTDGGIRAQLAREPSAVLGGDVLSGRNLPELAFLAGRHMATRRPEYELVTHIASLDELSTCFLAALKLVLGSAPAPGPLAETVSALANVLAQHQTAEERAELDAAIDAFSQSGGQANLRRWVAGVKICATRAGFALCGDLETAVSLLKSPCVAQLTDVQIAQHADDLCRFAVSGAYLKISTSMAG